MSAELEARARALLRRAAELSQDELARLLKGLSGPERRMIAEGWWAKWHEGQVPAKEDWRIWQLRAGRGFGKTRAGAEWVWARVREAAQAEAGTAAGECPLSIALVGANLDDVVKVMVEGPGGLVRSARSGEWAKWVASRWRVDFSTGASGFAYSAERPEKLRGPEHHFAWCDELAKWSRGDATWDNLMLGLRLGERPRVIVTTTPRPCALMRRIRGLEGFTETSGRTSDNRHSAEAYRADAYAAYAGTRLGRQELDGELLEDFEGALWTRAMLEACRAVGDSRLSLGRDGSGTAARGSDRPFRRVVVGVDPPAGTDGDECGILVCAIDGAATGWVLADASAGGLSPDGWARKVAAAAEAWGAHRVVAEANNGGRMVETVLRGANVALPLKLVHASEGKSARAEPVAALFEGRRVRLAGAFPALEDQLCGLLAGGGYVGPGRSPDRADACVWALTELMIDKPHAEPSVRGFF